MLQVVGEFIAIADATIGAGSNADLQQWLMVTEQLVLTQ